MRKFDTKVQHLKYKVLREVAREAWRGNLINSLYDLPEKIIPGKEPTMRCCVYKERAVIEKRIKIAMGGNVANPNVIEVIDIACDECPVSGYDVTDACRGCLAHRCGDVCRMNALTYDEHQKAHIDKKKCVNCGACAKVCPYSAIINRKRPCENACKIKAIHMAETGEAQIENDKCISCGACVYQCPSGAISDKSFILNVIDMIKKSEHNKKCKVYAVVAPSIAGQFSYAKLGQVITAMEELGFYHVVEAALGADMVAYAESKELAEADGFLTSSCCPAFVDYINKYFPALKDHISHNLSPAATISKYIKEREPDCKIVFVGPCTAKKMEFQKEDVRPYIDSVITFEELQALFDSRDIDVTKLEEGYLDNASYFGRIFARSGGLADAVRQGLKEHNLEDFDYKPISCDGIEACKIALLKASKNLLPNNFIEGMACIGGCIGGAGCLTHEAKSKKEVDDYGKEALEKNISDAIGILKY
ncbi:MAG: 4Fe-4S dicluster domain-containing protein [Firmicutes bacterium]|nr:4Fe-4S dicluster domain-containing protein [Bacillota bacterium]